MISSRSGLQDAEPDQLRAELVTDVHGLRRHVFEIQPHPRDGVVGATPLVAAYSFSAFFSGRRRPPVDFAAAAGGRQWRHAWHPRAVGHAPCDALLKNTA